MPRVPVAQNSVGIAEVSGAKIQAADFSGTGASAVGAGLQQLGRAGSQLANELDEVKINEASADAERQAADLRLRAGQTSIQFRDNAKPGAAGHVEQSAQWWDENSKALLESVEDKRVRRRLEGQLAGQRSSYLLQEGAWADQRRLEKLQTDDRDAVNLGVARIATAPNLETGIKYRAEERAAALDRANGYAGISDDDRARLVKKFDLDSTQATLELGVRTDYAKTKSLLDAGAFNELGADAIKQGYNAVEVEQRRAAAIAEHQTALATHAVRESIATVNARQSAGEVVPDHELQAAEKAAGLIGDTSAAVTLHATRVRNGVNRETQGWTPMQYDSERRRLLAKGEKRSADEDVRLDQIEKVAPARKQDFDKDPATWASLNGLPPPNLDPANPASWEKRSEWAAAVSAQTHRPTPFLLPAEVDHYRAQLTSPAGRLAVIDAIAPLGGLRAANAARQIAPDDATMARVVLLSKTARGSALAGSGARKDNPELVDGKNKVAARDQINSYIGGAAALLDQSEVSAVRDIALNIYADVATKNGIREFSPELLNTSMHRALGGTRDQRGTWRGGVGGWNNQPVLLPPTMSQDDFGRTLSRMPDWRAGSPKAPVYRDGSQIPASAIKKMTPVQRPDGLYEFHTTDGSVVQARSGGIMRIDVAGLNRTMANGR